MNRKPFARPLNPRGGTQIEDETESRKPLVCNERAYMVPLDVAESHARLVADRARLSEAVNIHIEMEAKLRCDRARLREALVMAEYCLDFANDDIVTAEDKHRALSAARAALKSTE